MADRPQVTSFIRGIFRSVWALELLCFLKLNRDRVLPHAEMVTELRASDQVVLQSVEALVAAGLVVVEVDGSARYCPASAELDDLVDASISLYRKSPDAVRRMIVAAANPGLTAFADAFRLRKD